MKKVLLVALFVIVVVGWGLAWMVLAAEVEVFTKVGTVNGSNEGHKSMVGLGINVASDPKKDFQGVVSLEGWSMWEDADEDGEIPGQGLGFFLEGRRNFKYGNLRFFPFVGVGFRYWGRDGSEKTVGEWHSISFIEGKAGLGAEYKFLYVKGAIRRPFWVNDDRVDPGLGFESEAGIKIKKFRIGLFYDRFGFDNNSNFNVNFWGGE